MNLLIVTQKVDQNDDVLGFFHGWIAEFAKHYEKVTVIALGVGKYDLPKNVRVLSLGKKKINIQYSIVSIFAKLKYILLFYYFIIKYSRDYDAVFVHMNQEYVLLGGPVWKILGKKVAMWRNHYAGSILTNIAAAFCDKVFCTSKFSYTARFKKTVFMPVGVDEQSAHMDEPIPRTPRSILFLGRLDVSKNPHLIIEALGILARQGTIFTATFVGGPSDGSSSYPAELRTQTEKLQISDRVTFVGAVPNTETYHYHRSHEIFVNASRSGMFDKTIFNAIVCGSLVLATSRDFKELVGSEFIFADNDAAGLAKKLSEFLSLSTDERLRFVGVLSNSIKQHSLPILADLLEKEMRIRN